MKRNLINLESLTEENIEHLFELTDRLKQNKGAQTDDLKGKSIGLLFQKPSNRTRVSFEVGIWQMGGNCIYLGPDEINLGKRESTEDVAKTLSRYLNAIVARTHTHDDIVDLAKHASIPVINGLSDLSHPCQALADIYTIKEKLGQLTNKSIAYIGDGNNVCHSLMLCCAKIGLHINIATPKNYEPNKDFVEAARAHAKNSGAKMTLTNSPDEAICGAHAIYSDVWVSMGQEAENEKRLNDFQKFQVNAKVAKKADPDYIFMHCLPAHRGQEVTAEIIDGSHSVVFDQAENRMHVQKAILIFLLGEQQ